MFARKLKRINKTLPTTTPKLYKTQFSLDVICNTDTALAQCQ